MPLPDFPRAEFAPRKLSNEEIADPNLVIAAFFDFAHLPQIREMLWDFLKITVSGTWHTESGESRNDMLYFFEKLEKVIEAIHIIYKQKIA
ncbi:MAG TPA: hypothetical protein VHM26_16810 [Chitinophagaceae bacterium]|jgi:hypothetical protein|nr:hypothetical protein [Chitinophagaceae bacterium]